MEIVNVVQFTNMAVEVAASARIWCAVEQKVSESRITGTERLIENYKRQCWLADIGLLGDKRSRKPAERNCYK